MAQIEAAERDRLTFSKMAGGGNDFVVIDDRGGRVADPSALTLRICTRRLSVGGDGLILVDLSHQASVRMRYYNADGSLAGFCANGTRCAARFARLNGMAGDDLTVETGAGVLRAAVRDQSVTLEIPTPGEYRAQRPLLVAGERQDGSFIRIGVPHYVIESDEDLWSRDVVTLGRAIRHHPELSDGANVNFVAVRDYSSLEVRTYERGVEDETLSCGSGVVASVLVNALKGRLRSPVSVLTRSGITLEVAFEMEGSAIRKVFLTGDARLIYTAELTAETITGFDPEFVRRPTSVNPVA
ncbi:MAG TPA: diaminopimelate epimerase [Thermoanaerobaculia bacterium]|nr:diaminopimelate epimerase [Thermoanaerobaculia bacterium]